MQFKNEINNKYTKEYVWVGPNLNEFGVFAPSLWDFQDPQRETDGKEYAFDNYWHVEDSNLASAGKECEVDEEHKAAKWNSEPECYSFANIVVLRYQNQYSSQEAWRYKLQEEAQWSSCIFTTDEAKCQAVYHGVETHNVEHGPHISGFEAHWIQQIVKECKGEADDNSKSNYELIVVIKLVIEIVIIFVLEHDQKQLDPEVDRKP